MKLDINENTRRSLNVALKDIYHKEGDFIEVTQWTNGEGFDVVLSDKQFFSLHDTEWDVLKKIIKHLNK